MDQFTWIFWVLLGVVLIVAETFTLGFVLLWFGVGALVAAAAGAFGVGLFGQFLIFAIVSVALTAASRTIFANLISRHGDDSIKMGVDSLPGQIGTVTSASKGALNEGAVKVYGSTWTAFPEDDAELVEGEKVEVVRVQGSSIYVRPVIKHLPDWRGDD
ncbi:MAG TPA: NfeD family protein [Pyrinomonadaceae bacterium]|nr:NfeD family protein [Pyrinomonadaceae bacterium]